MRTPMIGKLVETFKIERKDARHIKTLARLVDDADGLEAYVEKHCAATAAYARSCYHSPWRFAMWRRTMVLHAVLVIVGGNGIEPLGPDIHGTEPPPYEYVNMGDPYVATLIYRRETDNLYIGCWGDIAEKHPKW